MTAWFLDADGFTHTIAALLLLGRLGDIVGTRLITPTLRLETNPVVRHLGWRFGWASVAIASLPYFMLSMGIAAMVVSLMVSGSNLMRGWTLRALGEADSEALMLRVAARSQRRTALAFLISGAAFIVIAGVVLMWLSGSMRVPSFWFGVGIVIYGVGMALHGTAYVVRLFRQASVAAP